MKEGGDLKEWHDKRDDRCVAHSEGQFCCVDLWLENDPWKESRPEVVE